MNPSAIKYLNVNAHKGEVVYCRLTVGIRSSGILRIVLNDVLGQVCCPETSVNNYHLTLLKSPEKQREYTAA
jgi:hypothetical protein